MEAVASSRTPSGAYDLTVIGGGPAGASAAITAAHSGARVLLLERGRLPRQRVCGEFVSAESLDLLTALLSDSSRLVQNAARITHARMFVDGHVITAPITPPAASISRFDLDAELWQAAIAAGVDARLQVSAQGTLGRGPFRVTTSAGEFESRTLINAAGRWSKLKTKPATASPNETWLGMKAHFSEAACADSVDLYFFQGGYCGVQHVGPDPETGRTLVNACAMVRSDVAQDLAEVLALHPALKERSQTWEPLMEPVSTYPLAFHEPEPTNHNMLFAGDAAGFVDPFVGDGISLALRSGATAAECLLPFLQGRADLDETAHQYHRVYRQKLLPVFRNSARLRWFLKLPLALRGPVAKFLQNTPAITRRFVSMTR